MEDLNISDENFDVVVFIECLEKSLLEDKKTKKAKRKILMDLSTNIAFICSILDEEYFEREWENSLKKNGYALNKSQPSNLFKRTDDFPEKYSIFMNKFSINVLLDSFKSKEYFLVKEGYNVPNFDKFINSFDFNELKANIDFCLEKDSKITKKDIDSFNDAKINGAGYYILEVFRYVAEYRRILKNETNNFPVKEETIFLTTPAFSLIDTFVERKEVEQIKNIITSRNNKIVLTGISGVGKSEIARKIFHDLSSNGSVKFIAWVDFNEDIELSLCKSFLSISQTIKIEEQKRIMKSILMECGKDLFIIIDNYRSNSNDNFLRVLGGMHCKVMITTIENIHYRGFLNYDLPLLNCKQSIELFCEHYQKEIIAPAITKSIVKELGFHTLAIELTAKVASNDKITLESILDKLKQNKLDYSNLKVMSEHERLKEETVINQVKLLFSIYENTLDNNELMLLQKISIFGGLELNISQITDWFGLEDFSVLHSLVNHGWLKKKNITKNFDLKYDSFSIHRIASIAICEQTDLNLIFTEMFEKFQVVIDSENYFTPIEQFKILEHILSFINVCKELFNSSEHVVFIGSFSNWFKSWQQFETQKRLLLLAEEIIFANPLIANKTKEWINNLSAYTQGNIEIDKYLYKRLQKDEATYGADNPVHINHCNNLAEMHKKRNNNKKSRYYSLRALQLSKKFNNQVGITQALHNLGEIYSIENKIDKAEKYYIDCASYYNKQEKMNIENAEKIDLYYYIARSCISLGSIYINQKKYSDAKSYLLNSKEIFERLYGKNHIGTVNVYLQLGIVCCEEHQYVESEFYISTLYAVLSETKFLDLEVRASDLTNFLADIRAKIKKNGL